MYTGLSLDVLNETEVTVGTPGVVANLPCEDVLTLALVKKVPVTLPPVNVWL